MSVPPGRLDDPCQTTNKTIKAVHSGDDFTLMIFTDATWLYTRSSAIWGNDSELRHNAILYDDAEDFLKRVLFDERPNIGSDK